MADKNFHLLEPGYELTPFTGGQSGVVTEYREVDGRRYKREWWYWETSTGRILDPSGPQSDWKEVLRPRAAPEGAHVSHMHLTHLPESEQEDDRN